MNPPKKKPGFFDNADGTTSVAKIAGVVVSAVILIGLFTGGHSAAEGPALLIAIGGLVLAVVWIVFPFIVISKFNELIRLAREIKTNQESRKAGTEKAAPPPLVKTEQDVYRID